MSQSGAENLSAEIDSIAALNIDELRALWRETMGRPAPNALSKDLIARALAYRLQEQSLGGLDPHLRRLLMSQLKPGAEPVRRLKIGSVIVREYPGTWIALPSVRRHPLSGGAGDVFWGTKPDAGQLGGALRDADLPWPPA